MMYWKAAAVFLKKWVCHSQGRFVLFVCACLFISWHFISIAEEHEMLFCSFDLVLRITSREAEA